MTASMGQKMRQAANVIARDARARAALWSLQIPPTITVVARQNTAEIRSQVGPSYPNEVRGVRHPVFGNRRRWVTNDYRPFLAPAADAKADEATRIIAEYIDDVCHDNGFKGTG